MTDHVAPPGDSSELVAALQERLRAVHTTLLFIAVLLCVMLATNLVILTTD